MAWQPGETINGYKIDKELGRGGMATVYRAHHLRLERDAAIKVIHPVLQTDADFFSRFEREARILAQLVHPNIVPVHDFNEADGQPYLVMTYISGPTLKETIAKRPLSLPEIVQLVQALGHALTYAHKQGVLHRDVKPANVIFDQDGRPYLTDFGLARVAHTGESSLSTGMIIGTPNYVSPEQAEGVAEITPATDVYSLGVMLYELVVGRLPFQAKSPYSTIHMHIHEQPPLPSELNPEIPTEVELVLLQALEKRPENRYASPQELADAFKTAVERSGLRGLSEDRSGAFEARPTEDDGTPPAPAVPKRGGGSAFNSALLLLEGEESWANLPREEIARRRLKERRNGRLGLLAHAIPYVLVNALIVLGSAADGNFSLGSFIPALGWGAGLVSHALAVWFRERGQVERLYQSFDEQMSRTHGPAWRETVADTDIHNAWQVAQKQYEEYQGAMIHSGVFVLINILVWFTWLLAMGDTGGFVFPYPLIVTAGWGIGLIANWVDVRMDRDTPANTESIQAELDIMGGQRSAPRKRKHTLEDGVRISEDGELTDSMVDQLEGRR